MTEEEVGFDPTMKKKKKKKKPFDPSAIEGVEGRKSSRFGSTPVYKDCYSETTRFPETFRSCTNDRCGL